MIKNHNVKKIILAIQIIAKTMSVVQKFSLTLYRTLTDFQSLKTLVSSQNITHPPQHINDLTVTIHHPSFLPQWFFLCFLAHKLKLMLTSYLLAQRSIVCLQIELCANAEHCEVLFTHLSAA